MARRSKKDMELMQDDVRYYLTFNNNDAHKAHEAMIKEHLESGQMIPYYIKGVKDFIKVSQELAVELNRKEQMKKKDQERFEARENTIDYIMNLSKEEIKRIYRTYKNRVFKNEEICLVDIYMLIFSNELEKKHINQLTISTFNKIIEMDQEQKAV